MLKHIKNLICNVKLSSERVHNNIKNRVLAKIKIVAGIYKSLYKPREASTENGPQSFFHLLFPLAKKSLSKRKLKCLGEAELAPPGNAT